MKKGFNIAESLYGKLMRSLSELKSKTKDKRGYFDLASREFKFDHPTYLFLEWAVMQVQRLDILSADYRPEDLNSRAPSSVEDLLMSYDLFEDLDLPWTFCANQAFSKRAKDIEIQELEMIIKDLMVLCSGNYSSKLGFEVIQEGPCFGMCAFYKKYRENLCIVVISEVYKYPVIEENSIKNFHYSQHLQALDIVLNKQKALKGLKEYTRCLHGNKYILYSEIRNNEKLKPSFENCFRVSRGKTLPLAGFDIYLDLNEQENYQFDEETQQFVTIEEYNKKQMQENYQEFCIMKKINANLFERIMNPESCKLFVEVLKKIQSFNITLSNQEIEIIGNEGNVLAIGRSGTGKTTCSVLRIFAMEFLFRFNYNKSNQQIIDKKDENLRTVFLSVSPILCNQVKAYYYSLIESAKNSNLSKNSSQEKRPKQNREEKYAFEWDPTQQYDLIDRGEINKFPLFICLRSFIYYIDRSLQCPFFQHRARVRDVQLGYAGRKRGLAFVYNAFEERYRKSFEIDFKYYLEFWKHRIKNTSRISPLTIWTEISAFIKGSPEAFKSNGHISKEEYLGLGQKVSLLDRNQRKEIWKYFELYEEWKESLKAYDFQDAINHILYEIYCNGYNGPTIHYVMVDEVQDCSNSVLTILLRIAQQNFFATGDTAQTISEGIGFRFCDLRSLFRGDYVAHTDPKMSYLTTNYRSHGRILDLSNSVVAMIQCMFPETIDPIEPEESVFDGEKPILIENNLMSTLVRCVNGNTASVRDIIEFGCGQVLLVRNESSKENLNPDLEGLICLTILESKGLEFNDVIIYNFFTDSKIESHEWRILERLVSEGNSYKMSSSFNKVQYSLLCVELKHLYVAITRAKKRVIFYDENLEKRFYLEQLWIHQDLVQFSNTANRFRARTDQDLAVNHVEAWRKQGHALFNKELFSQAKRCFERAEDKKMEEICIARISVEKAHNFEGIIQTYNDSSNSQNKALTKTDKQKIKEYTKNIEDLYLQAGDIFRKYDIMKEAGNCYYTCNRKNKALECYEKGSCWPEAGELCLEMYRDKSRMKHVRKQLAERAFQNFNQARYHSKCLFCKMKLSLEDAKMYFIEYHRYIDKDVSNSFVEKYLKDRLGKLNSTIQWTNEYEYKLSADAPVAEFEIQPNEEEYSGEEEIDEYYEENYNAEEIENNYYYQYPNEQGFEGNIEDRNYLNQEWIARANQGEEIYWEEDLGEINDQYLAEEEYKEEIWEDEEVIQKYNSAIYNVHSEDFHPKQEYYKKKQQEYRNISDEKSEFERKFQEFDEFKNLSESSFVSDREEIDSSKINHEKDSEEGKSQENSEEKLAEDQEKSMQHKNNEFSLNANAQAFDPINEIAQTDDKNSKTEEVCGMEGTPETNAQCSEESKIEISADSEKDLDISELKETEVPVSEKIKPYDHEKASELGETGNDKPKEIALESATHNNEQNEVNIIDSTKTLITQKMKESECFKFFLNFIDLTKKTEVQEEHVMKNSELEFQNLNQVLQCIQGELASSQLTRTYVDEIGFAFNIEREQFLYILENIWNHNHLQLFSCYCFKSSMVRYFQSKILAILFEHKAVFTYRYKDFSNKKYRQRVIRKNIQINSILKQTMTWANRNLKEKEKTTILRPLSIFGLWKEYLPLYSAEFALSFFQFDAVYAIEGYKTFNYMIRLMPDIFHEIYGANPIIKQTLFENIMFQFNNANAICLKRHFKEIYNSELLLKCIPVDYPKMRLFWSMILNRQWDWKDFTNKIDECHEFLFKAYKMKDEEIENFNYTLQDSVAFVVHLAMSYIKKKKKNKNLNDLKIYQSEKLIYCLLIIAKIMMNSYRYFREDREIWLNSILSSFGVKNIDSKIWQLLPIQGYFVYYIHSELLFDPIDQDKYNAIPIDPTGEFMLIDKEHIFYKIRIKIMEFLKQYTENKLKLPLCIQMNEKNNDACYYRAQKIDSLVDKSNKLGILYLFCRIATVFMWKINENIFFKTKNTSNYAHRIEIQKMLSEISLLQLEFPFRRVPLTKWSYEAMLRIGVYKFVEAETVGPVNYFESYSCYSLTIGRKEFLRLVNTCILRKYERGQEDDEGTDILRLIKEIVSIDVLVMHGKLRPAVEYYRDLFKKIKNFSILRINLQRMIAYLVKFVCLREDVKVPVALEYIFKTYYPKNSSLNIKYHRDENLMAILDKYFMIYMKNGCKKGVSREAMTLFEAYIFFNANYKRNYKKNELNRIKSLFPKNFWIYLKLTEFQKKSENLSTKYLFNMLFNNYTIMEKNNGRKNIKANPDLEVSTNLCDLSKKIKEIKEKTKKSNMKNLIKEYDSSLKETHEIFEQLKNYELKSEMIRALRYFDYISETKTNLGDSQSQLSVAPS